MALPSLTEISDKAKRAFKRFPITLIWSILGSFYCIYVIESNSNDFFEHQLNVLLTLILGVSWLIGTQFYIEQRENSKNWNGLKIIVLGLLVLFYWHLPNRFDDDPSYVIRFFLYLLAGHLFVFFAPFVLKWDKEAYWNYLKSIAFAILRSGIFSGILYLGLVFALLAIEALFEAHIPSERYGQLFVFCLGVVNTWIYLSDFPKNIREDKIIHFNKALEVFVKYILIPLVILYIGILYAYSFKILFQWELPQGWVSYLVTALALLGFVVQVIIDPVQKTIKSWTINIFYPWFYILLLPLIVLLFVAIVRRIGDYGITENRYFVLITAFWILGVSLYLLLAKKKRLKTLPISLFILAILSSFGFWGAFSVSKNSQVQQFKKVFTEVKSKNGMANNQEYDQLKSIITYLDDRKALSRLDETAQMPLKETFEENVGAPSMGYIDAQKILDSLGIVLDSNASSPDQLHYNYYGDPNGIHNYAIEGFNYMAPITFNSYNENQQEIGTYSIHFDSEAIVLTLLSKKDSSKSLVIPLREKLLDLTEHGQYLTGLGKQELTLESKNDRILVKLILTGLEFNKKQDSVTIDHANAYMLLKQL